MTIQASCIYPVYVHGISYIAAISIITTPHHQKCHVIKGLSHYLQRHTVKGHQHYATGQLHILCTYMGSFISWQLAL